MKTLPKITISLYLLVLVWLVLFKFSVDLPAALTDNNMRILNLVPFADYSSGNIKELIYNFLVFIPFGLFLSTQLKQANIWQRLAVIFAFSFGAETIQYMFALGAADITDVISNTSGGLAGLLLYNLCRKYFQEKDVDNFVVTAGAVLLVSSVLLLGVLFVNGVRFKSAHQPSAHPDFQRNIPSR